MTVYIKLKKVIISNRPFVDQNILLILFFPYTIKEWNKFKFRNT